MSLIRILLCAIALATCAVAQGASEHPQGDAHAQGGATAGGTMAMDSSAFFTERYSHLQPHALGAAHGPLPEGAQHEAPSVFAFYNVNAAQLVALGLMLVVFMAVLASFRSSRTPWLLRVFRGFCRWIRDEMVFKVMGEEEGRKFAPYFMYLFFFIAFMNLVGMIPSSVTATACVFVTAALAILTFVMMVGGGMMHQGAVAFWKHLLPHGLPAWLVPLMFVLEVIGLLVKPFALTIRLFANMLAGHLVIYSFVGMIFLFAKMFEMGVLSWGTALPAVGMGVFISIIEAFVALLQAYIFTYLSIIFVQQSLHPAH